MAKSKERLDALNTYLTSLKDKLKDAVPEKHSRNPESYKAFLKNEIRLVELTLEAAKNGQ